MKTYSVFILPHEKILSSTDEVISIIGEEKYQSIQKETEERPTFLPSVAKAYLLRRFTPHRPLAYGPYGKPYQEGCYFNLSNTKDASVLVVADRDCGVDIEGARSMSRDFQLSVFGEETGDEDPVACWTRKEALCKAEGGGLSGAPLRSIPFQKGHCRYKNQNYYVETIRHENWTISVAIEGKEEFQINVVEAI